MNITGSFDPTALERGAKALKEMDSSANAKQAFEVTKLQEVTKQKESQLEMEKQQTSRQQLIMQRTQLEGEEKRKTLSHQEDQERRTAQYKTQLESELYQRKLEDQQKQNEAWLQQQHQNFMRQEETRKQNDQELEEQRRRTMAEQARLDRETLMMKTQAEAEARAKTERENVDVRIREMRATRAEDRATRLQSLDVIFSSLGSAISNLLDDKAKMTALVTGLGGVALAVYAAKNGTRVVGNLAEKTLGRPPLVRETSRWTWNKGLVNMFAFNTAKSSGQMLDKIVLEDTLNERLQWMTNSLQNAKKRDTVQTYAPTRAAGNW